jgi:hypothetical protein
MAAAATASHMGTTTTAARVGKRQSAGQDHACRQCNHDLAQHFIYSFGRSRPLDQT